MADFVAVLKKTIAGLPENTPEMRDKVYEKARATVAAKLAAISPPPGAGVAERQKQALEDAISDVEADYTNASDDPFAELVNVFVEPKRQPLPPMKAPEPFVIKSPPPSFAPPVLPGSQFQAKPWPGREPDEEVEPLAALSEQDDDPSFDIDREQESADEIVDTGYEEPQRRRSFAPLIAAVVVLALLAGGGYAVWLNKEAFVALLDDFRGSQEVATAPAAGDTAPVTPPPATATKPAVDSGAGEIPQKFTQRLNDDGTEVDEGPAGGIASIGEGTSVAAATQPSAPAVDLPPVADTPPPADQTPPPAAPTAETPAPAAPEGDVAASGAEVPPAVPAPAAPPATTDPAVAEADPAAPPTDPAVPPPAATDPAAAETPPTTPPAADPATAAADTASPAAPAADPAAPPTAPAVPPAEGDAATPPATTETAAATTGDAQMAVGQKAIFYEESTNVAEGSAEPGSVVWTLVQESPGNDLPPEPAIRAEATIPGKDVELRMTIKRNIDKTIPASHTIELIFITPESFDGGGVDNVLRFAMKNTEEDPGNALLAIPVKITDGYFLIALNDTKAEIDTNLGLLRRQQWIDVPLVYKSGRRALFTLEKGVPGDKVFDEAIKVWQSAATSAG